MVAERLPPQNVEAEQSLLGSILIDPEAIIRVAPIVRPDDFYRDTHATLYEAALELHERRQPADFVTMRDVLEQRGQLELVGGTAYLTALVNSVPTSAHAEYYAQIVQRTAMLRRLIRAATEIAGIAYEPADDADEVIDRAEQILFAVAERRHARDLAPISQVIARYYDRIQLLADRKGQPLGIPTGFEQLDRLLGGLQPSDLIIVAARPSMGKTALALTMATSAAKRFRMRIAMFSLEMSAEQLVQRLISAETGIDAQRLRLGDVREEEWQLLVQAASTLSETNIFIDDSPSLTVMEMRSKARRIHAQYGLDLVIVDYLQLMQGDRRSENRVQEISNISRGLKGLARELNVPVVALSQLSRAVEARQDKHPQLSDLRESGSIEQDADVVLFIYRDAMYFKTEEEWVRAYPDRPYTPGLAEVWVSKQRNGPAGKKVDLFFVENLAVFRELQRERVQFNE
jgi:replicative DNA helicase